MKEPCDLMSVTWSKGHVWEPVTLCHHLSYCGVDTSSAGGDIYFICHVTEQDHSVEMSCVFMGESSLPHVTTLKSLVTIGILIVKRKNASSKTSYKNVLTLKNWVDWITDRQEKNITNTKMVYFEKKCPEIKKNHIFTLMTTFYNFTLKMETSWAKKVLKPIL